MIDWGEKRRKKDPSFFCQLATSEGSNKKVWVISDARRLTDVDYFRQRYSNATITLRVECDIATREERGFNFTKGVDDAESECGLDTGVTWDILMHNNGNKEELDKGLEKILESIALKCEGH
ncbi:hypothetical protein EGW08_005765 [Elysia chlorotica]|uniref:Phosphomevalonate kinase n=1 Tax=Elysia chlorotica TaxID=188477 RepID=A0A433TY04_ELYCH|nr:hypothetical protein EGW08_005765 [Elysia chlorotica]